MGLIYYAEIRNVLLEKEEAFEVYLTEHLNWNCGKWTEERWTGGGKDIICEPAEILWVSDSESWIKVLVEIMWHKRQTKRDFCVLKINFLLSFVILLSSYFLYLLRIILQVIDSSVNWITIVCLALVLGIEDRKFKVQGSFLRSS